MPARIPLKIIGGALSEYAPTDAVSADGIVPRSVTTLTLGDTATTGVSLTQSTQTAKLLVGTADPSTPGVAAPEGSLYLRTTATAGQLWIKTNALSTQWTQIVAGSSPTLQSAYTGGAAIVATVGKAIAFSNAVVGDNTDLLSVTRTASSTRPGLNVQMTAASQSGAGVLINRTGASSGHGLEITTDASATGNGVSITTAANNITGIAVTNSGASTGVSITNSQVSSTKAALVVVSNSAGASGTPYALNVSQVGGTVSHGIFVTSSNTGTSFAALCAETTHATGSAFIARTVSTVTGGLIQLTGAGHIFLTAGSSAGASGETVSIAGGLGSSNTGGIVDIAGGTGTTGGEARLKGGAGQASGNAGGVASVTGGAGLTSGAGGAVTITGGATPSGTVAGGGVTITSGQNNSGTGDAGLITIKGGRPRQSAPGSTNDAKVLISGGDTTAGVGSKGGDVDIKGGINATNSGAIAAGAVTVSGGDITVNSTSIGGPVTVRGGDVGATTNSGSGGSLTLRGGDVLPSSTAGGFGGDVAISGGAVSRGTGRSGNVNITGGVPSGSLTAASAGAVTISGGIVPGVSNTGAGGALSLSGGWSNLGVGGAASLIAGYGTTGGALTLEAGGSEGTGPGGAIGITAGYGGATSTGAGAITISAGNSTNATGTAPGASVSITAGGTTSSNVLAVGGNITLTGGAASNAVTKPGTVNIVTTRTSTAGAAAKDGPVLTLQQSAQTIDMFAGTVDPSSGSGVVAGLGSVYYRNNGTTNGELWQKTLTAATGWSPIYGAQVIAGQNANFNFTTFAPGTIICVASSAARTGTLPTPVKGLRWTVTDAGVPGTSGFATFNFTVARTGTERIAGVAANFVANTNLATLRLICDGTDWWLI